MDFRTVDKAEAATSPVEIFYHFLLVVSRPGEAKACENTIMKVREKPVKPGEGHGLMDVDLVIG